MSEDPLDWQAWLARHGPAALLYARHMSRSPEDAEDAVHDGFLRFWNNRHEARDRAAFLFACVRSAALDHRRGDQRRKRRQESVGRVAKLFTSPETGNLGRQEVVEFALAELPEPQREVVVLKIWAGLTFGQIAEGLKESPNTVAARYRYAMEKLAVLLVPEVENEH